MQAGSNLEGNLKNVEKLVSHPAFSITNPNACYSLFLAFLRSPVNFHAADGSGYKFIADSILKVWGLAGFLVHCSSAFSVGCSGCCHVLCGPRSSCVQQCLTAQHLVPCNYHRVLTQSCVASCRLTKSIGPHFWSRKGGVFAIFDHLYLQNLASA